MRAFLALVLAVLQVVPASACLCSTPEATESAQKAPRWRWLGTTRFADVDLYDHQGPTRQFILRGERWTDKWVIGGAAPYNWMKVHGREWDGLGNATATGQALFDSFGGRLSAGTQVEFPTGEYASAGLSSPGWAFLPHVGFTRGVGIFAPYGSAGVRFGPKTAVHATIVNPHERVEALLRAGVAATLAKGVGAEVYFDGQRAVADRTGTFGLVGFGATVALGGGVLFTPGLELPVGPDKRVRWQGTFGLTYGFADPL